ncbi:MAG: hypothetical protein ACYS6Z_19805, partial [Planctomycetota bacterium]
MRTHKDEYVFGLSMLLAWAVAPVAAAGDCTHPIFPDAAEYGVGDGPRSVAVGDLDGDFDLDLAVANEHAYHVSVLLNDGDGTFAQEVA